MGRGNYPTLAIRSRGFAGAPRACRGFTLLELIVTLVIAMVLTMIAVPSLRHMIVSGHLTDINNSLAGDLQFARTEAVSRQVNVSVAASAGGWQDGWKVEAMPATSTAVVTVLRRYPRISTQYKVGATLNAAAATSVTYQPQGSLRLPDSAAVGACFTISASKAVGNTPLYLQVMRAGMLQQTKGKTPPSSSCPKPAS